jgi:hypothetical protein
MAHFALVKNNTVESVTVVGNEITTVDGVEDEQRGIDFLKKIFPNETGDWVQCSYNRNSRNVYPKIGDIYDAEKDIFIEAKPFESWVLNDDNKWESPVGPKPEEFLGNEETEENGYDWIWDEPNLEWVKSTSREQNERLAEYHL